MTRPEHWPERTRSEDDEPEIAQVVDPRRPGDVARAAARRRRPARPARGRGRSALPDVDVPRSGPQVLPEDVQGLHAGPPQGRHEDRRLQVRRSEEQGPEPGDVQPRGRGPAPDQGGGPRRHGRGLHQGAAQGAPGSAGAREKAQGRVQRHGRAPDARRAGQEAPRGGQEEVQEGQDEGQAGDRRQALAVQRARHELERHAPDARHAGGVQEGRRLLRPLS